MKNYYVYKHTAPNGKVYIGLTCQRPEKRWGNGCNYKTNKYFSAAIIKYGWNSFTHEILFYGLSKEEAENKEIELIAYYKSNQREFGYNIDNGGKARGRCSEETKQLISQIQKGRKPSKLMLERAIQTNTGKHRSEETKRKISQSQKGKIMSKEARGKMSIAHKGKKIPEQVKRKMSEKAKLSWTPERRKKFGEMHKGEKSHLFGRKFTQEEIKNLQEKCRGENSVLSKRVGQYNLDGKLIKIYDSVREAGRCGFNHSTISAVCRGEHKTHRNFIWKYI